MDEYQPMNELQKYQKSIDTLIAINLKETESLKVPASFLPVRIPLNPEFRRKGSCTRQYTIPIHFRKLLLDDTKEALENDVIEIDRDFNQNQNGETGVFHISK